MRTLAAVLAIVIAFATYTAFAAEPNALAGIVAAHNKERNMVGVPPLSWSPDLAEQAQDWADQLAEAGCAVKHRNPGASGQNILVMKGDVLPPPRMVVMTWAAERQYYDSRSGRCRNGEECSHYTQVVWKASRSVGCGVAECGRTGAVLVCEYDPVGNVVGRRPY